MANVQQELFKLNEWRINDPTSSLPKFASSITSSWPKLPSPWECWTKGNNTETIKHGQVGKSTILVQKRSSFRRHNSRCTDAAVLTVSASVVLEALTWYPCAPIRPGFVIRMGKASQVKVKSSRFKVWQVGYWQSTVPSYHPVESIRCKAKKTKTWCRISLKKHYCTCSYENSYRGAWIRVFSLVPFQHFNLFLKFISTYFCVLAQKWKIFDWLLETSSINLKCLPRFFSVLLFQALLEL